ncbi:hypothetical protein PIB30_077855 [Stylosanthes scabra]|uniref:Uncharacterized protein n=1 Tax=Stylosanthes scabra TaxID=79078 RepID=A0ABU6YQ44_9FABA|nr:hypothetical protein [Stylosanthes scabra]
MASKQRKPQRLLLIAMNGDGFAFVHSCCFSDIIPFCFRFPNTNAFQPMFLVAGEEKGMSEGAVVIRSRSRVARAACDERWRPARVQRHGGCGCWLRDGVEAGTVEGEEDGKREKMALFEEEEECGWKVRIRVMYCGFVVVG